MVVHAFNLSDPFVTSLFTHVDTLILQLFDGYYHKIAFDTGVWLCMLSLYHYGVHDMSLLLLTPVD